MADDVDLRRIERIMLATALGLDPGPTTWAERVVVKRFIDEAVRSWRRPAPCRARRTDWT